MYRLCHYGVDSFWTDQFPTIWITVFLFPSNESSITVGAWVASFLSFWSLLVSWKPILGRFCIAKGNSVSLEADKLFAAKGNSVSLEADKLFAVLHETCLAWPTYLTKNGFNLCSSWQQLSTNALPGGIYMSFNLLRRLVSKGGQCQSLLPAWVAP